MHCIRFLRVHRVVCKAQSPWIRKRSSVSLLFVFISWTEGWRGFYGEEGAVTIKKKKIHAPENCLPSPSKNNFPSLKQGLVIIDDLDLSQSDSKQRFLFRLTPYFRGNHHLEEVMYYENLRRSQLLTLIEKFRDVLFSCQHEDPVTLYFYNRWHWIQKFKWTVKEICEQ